MFISFNQYIYYILNNYNCMSSTKVIVVDLQEKTAKKENRQQSKEKLKRKITNTTKWNSLDKDTSLLFDNLNTTNKDLLRENQRLFLQQINQKIYGYKTQDIEKKIFNETQFIDLSGILHLFEKSSLKCFYCLNTVELFYEYVREPKQWTLERLDNSIGHNYGNLEIACLSCNIKRRTMYHERFVFTKQLNIIKQG